MSTTGSVRFPVWVVNGGGGGELADSGWESSCAAPGESVALASSSPLGSSPWKCLVVFELDLSLLIFW